jgi:D-alanyl-D-alanine carboxypeptidase/D-alanyl-D-alanine-endopeptidase (penicillin-binding protein 4)
VGLAAGAAWQAGVSDREHDLPPREAAAVPPPEVRTPLFSLRRIPIFLQEPEADRRLVAALESASSDLPADSCVAVTESGRSRYAHQAEAQLVPASTQKLLVGAAVLAVLGPDYRFTTRVLARATPVDGVIDGDVWLLGGGDPVLTTADYSERYDDVLPYTDVDMLAQQVQEAGVSTITGAVIGDESRFDSLRWVPSWPERFRPGNQTQSGPLSALSVNDGFSRWDPTRTSYGHGTPAAAPAEFAAAFFDDLLEARDLVIRRRAQAGVAPLDATHELASIQSPPLGDIVRQMLLTSDNMTAELLLKALSAEVEPPGGTAAGVALMRGAIEELGIDLAGSTSADGSGLDGGNRVSCGQLVAILDLAGGLGDAIDTGLAVAGESGTMRSRLVGTAAEGRVSGKTGTLRDAVSLAGRVESVAGRSLTFAILSNGYPMPEGVRTVHDRIVLDLVAYPDGPDLALLEPLPVTTR